MFERQTDIYTPTGMTCRCGDRLTLGYPSIRPVFGCRRRGMRYIVTMVVADAIKDAAWQAERQGGGP